MEKQTKTPSSGIARFKRVNKLNFIFSIVMLIMSAITIELQMILIAAHAGSIPVAGYALIADGIDLVLILAWTVFMIISIVRGFKAKPIVKPVKTLICWIIVLILIWLGIILAFTGGILGVTLPAGTESLQSPQYIAALVITAVGIALGLLPGSIIGLCVSNKNRKILKKKVA